MELTPNKRLGEYLREISTLSSPQIVEALRRQVIERDRGQQRRIGEILVSMGFVEPNLLEVALQRQQADFGAER
jgi:hypothetical protein